LALQINFAVHCADRKSSIEEKKRGMAPSNAIRIHKNGGPEVMQFERIEVGKPGPEEVLLRHTAIGLNFTDIHHRTGRYPGGAMPIVLGMEAAGVVEETGADVRDLKAGDRVVYGGASPSLMPGAYSELRVIRAALLVKLPSWIDDETAAAVFLKGLTAQYLIRGAHHVEAGETILVHAAAGGVGLLMCQWLRHLGVIVIGSVSSAEKAEMILKNGAHHAIVYTKEDVLGRARELTDGIGVSVVYDSVGASTFETSLSSLRKRGVLVAFGSASGPVPPFDIFRLNRMGSLSLTGAGLADYITPREQLVERAEDLFNAVKQGIVKISINERYPLAEAARAHQDLEARRTIGSSVIIP
jgi:NADPH2:quinone reductase